MIKNREELRKVLLIERKLYLNSQSIVDIIKLRITNENLYWIWKYVYYLRKCEYYLNKRNLLGLLLCRRKKNRLGQKLSIEIKENCFDVGLRIFHGNIVVNENARIGKNCKLHGNNCIGNNGKIDKNPMISDNFELGVGAVVIGDIKIGKNVIVGANSLVNKDILSDWVVVGNPGRKIE